MSRQIGVDETKACYRAVIVRAKNPLVNEPDVVTLYEGVYDHPSTAKGRTSFWRRHLGDRFISGRVERGTVTWEVLEDDE